MGVYVAGPEGHAGHSEEEGTMRSFNASRFDQAVRQVHGPLPVKRRPSSNKGTRTWLHQSRVKPSASELATKAIGSLSREIHTYNRRKVSMGTRPVPSTSAVVQGPRWHSTAHAKTPNCYRPYSVRHCKKQLCTA